MGLALAYAGSYREDLLAYLLPHVADNTIIMGISGLAALEKYEQGDKSLDEKWAKFMALGLGLVKSPFNNSTRLLTTLQDFRMLLVRPLPLIIRS